MERHKKQWLKKEKDKWEYAGLQFSDNGYEMMDEKIYWNSEWFHLLYEHFSKCKEFYCTIAEWGNEKRHYVQFSYVGSTYQFEFLKKETGLLEWDVAVKEKEDRVYHRMFRNIQDDVLIQVSKRVELILTMVTNMPIYRIRLVTGQYYLNEKNNVLLFELVDQIIEKG